VWVLESRGLYPHAEIKKIIAEKIIKCDLTLNKNNLMKQFYILLTGKP
jgi:hypothetical protein